ncbi:MAG: exodeoxyribonuclease VII large subunit [Spirochaetales bacterium]|nr:exodeoxyribonuclease VII large subunit [Spirochaetales bacterium]
MTFFSEHIYGVSEITGLIRQTLEEEYAGIRVKGELSNVRLSSTGHLYFTLKDSKALISCVIFAGKLARLHFQPVDGALVIAGGSISVYAPRGTYQIICDTLEGAGEGDILAALEERKRRLAGEGLFDPAKKKRLPLMPQRVAVITSPTGAALRDILRVTKRRNAGLDILILPAPVQGEGAAEKIAAQIRRANRYNLGDVIIVGRGGGSLEDLLPFSHEEVVRAIAASEIPVISAVGHETDQCLADLAADLRAPTPSAAAEMVTALQDDMRERVRELRHAVTAALQGSVERTRLLLDRFKPQALEMNFRVLLQPFLIRFDDAKEDLVRALRDLAVEKRHRLDLAVRELEGASPLNILRKGYAVVSDEETGRILTRAEDTADGRRLHVRLHQGALKTRVEEIMES